MADDDRFIKLFSGEPGSVLGDMKEAGQVEIPDPPPETKLSKTKEQGAKDKRQPPQRKRLDGGGRLPPGQSLTNDWPILDLGLRPLIPLDQWDLTVTGAVENPVKLTWDQFNALPQADLTSDIHCVTAWSTYDNRWGGVAVKTLLDLVKPRAEAAHVAMMSHDGYRTNVPLEHFSDEQSLIAHSWGGAPLERDHGGPVRAVIPSLYFWKSAKWLRQITILEKDAPGYWETRGYHNLGDPWKQQRYG